MMLTQCMKAVDMINIYKKTTELSYKCQNIYDALKPKTMLFKSKNHTNWDIKR